MKLTEHRIDVGNSTPIKQRYYPVSPKIQEAIYAEVNKMLEAGVIEPSNNEWSTPSHDKETEWNIPLLSRFSKIEQRVKKGRLPATVYERDLR